MDDLKVGDLVGACWMSLVGEGRDWIYGIVVTPLVKGKTTVKFNCGDIHTFSAWEIAHNGLKVLS